MNGAFLRMGVIAGNTYREAVRARLLISLVGLAVATSIYSVFIGALSLHQEGRDVANIGSFALSFFSVGIAIVLGATSLYRELELKTVFPVLSRPLERWEYVLGKYFGTMLTLFVFVLIEAGFVLWLLTLVTRDPAGADGLVRAATGGIVRTAAGGDGSELAIPFGVGVAFLAAFGLLLWKQRERIVLLLIPWALSFFVTMAFLAHSAGIERRVVLANATLTLFEGAIIAAVATFFSSFSSPFLTAGFTFAIFLVGRSGDTLGNLPVRIFGAPLKALGQFLARVLPNLQIYVPPRPVLQGTLTNVSTVPYVASAALHSILYASVVLAFACVLFRRRDFQ